MNGVKAILLLTSAAAVAFMVTVTVQHHAWWALTSLPAGLAIGLAISWRRFRRQHPGDSAGREA